MFSTSVAELALNDAQQTAVTHRGGPLLIVAGAGTGKTKTLVARLAHLIETGTAPDRILLLTFTRRSAAEMVHRAGLTTDPRAAAQVWGGTFHATANRLLRQFGGALGLPPGFTVLDQGDSLAQPLPEPEMIAGEVADCSKASPPDIPAEAGRTVGWSDDKTLPPQ